GGGAGGGGGGGGGGAAAGRRPPGGWPPRASFVPSPSPLSWTWSSPAPSTSTPPLAAFSVSLVPSSRREPAVPAWTSSSPCRLASTSTREGHAPRATWLRRLSLHWVDRIAFYPAAPSVVTLDPRPALAPAEHAHRSARPRP